MTNLIAIIPARGGSKGLIKKNILDLNGKPLILHTIDMAIKSNIFKEIFVSTEDENIKTIVRNKNIKIINRPISLATDDSSILDVLVHIFNNIDFSNTLSFMLLQPTSPLRTEQHIIESYDLFKESVSNSLVSTYIEKHTPYKLLIKKNNSLIPLFNKEYLTMPRQKLEKTYRINGAIYISYINEFLKNKDLFVEPLINYNMTFEDSYDIDTLEDFILCKKRMLKNH